MVELPSAPNIYINGNMEYGAQTEVNEGADVDLSCEVLGGKIIYSECVFRKAMYVKKIKIKERFCVLFKEENYPI